MSNGNGFRLARLLTIADRPWAQTASRSVAIARAEEFLRTDIHITPGDYVFLWGREVLAVFAVTNGSSRTVERKA